MRGDDRGGSPDADDGIVLRPVPSVLDESALVPDANLAEPPTDFTHEVAADTAYWYRAGDREPNGMLSAGTPVRVVRDEGEVGGAVRCRVVDGRGLSVVVARAALRPLR